MVRVRADGTKELVALDDGHRESTESWADLLRSCMQRGMAAPVLAVGDGALGFWAAVRDVFPHTREQPCWFHKIANVVNCLLESAQPGAQAARSEIWNAEDRDHAEAAAPAFVAGYGVKWPKAVAKITEDLDTMLAFYDYPAKHRVHLRTTNPIESTFATVRLRQRVIRCPGSWVAGGGDGVQAHRVRPNPLARRERTSPRRPHPSRRDLQERTTSSNDPTSPARSQETISKSRDTPIHRS